MEKFIGKTKTSKMFIGKDNSIVNDPDKAFKFLHIGDCMRSCVEVNEQLGYHVFTVNTIYEK